MFSHYSLLGSQDSVVDVATKLWAARSKVQIPAGEISLFFKTSSRALGLSRLLLNVWGWGGVSRLGFEADHYLPSSVEVKNGLSYSPFCHIS